MPQLPIVVPSNFRIIAHRGASGYAPENTMAAFTLAERMGASEVELDVRFSKDEKLMICHDESLDRFGYPGVKVGDRTATDLAILDMGSWFSPYLYRGESMMRLDTLFRVFGERFTYNVEMKEDASALPKALLEAILSHHLRGRIIVTSKYFHLLEEVRRLDLELRVGWLVAQLTPYGVDRAATAGFFQVCPRTDGVDAELVRSAHAKLPEVRAHHVSSIADALHALDSGCDGVTINWPDWLIHSKAAAT